MDFELQQSKRIYYAVVHLSRQPAITQVCFYQISQNLYTTKDWWKYCTFQILTIFPFVVAELWDFCLKKKNYFYISDDNSSMLWPNFIIYFTVLIRIIWSVYSESYDHYVRRFSIEGAVIIRVQCQLILNISASAILE